MTTSSIYFQNVSNTKITLPPNTLNMGDILNSVLKHLQEKLEGKCSKDGYIKKNSIKIIKKSLGKFEIGQFNGNMSYNVEYSAEYCNPVEGSQIECKVISINKIGVLSIVSDPDNQPIKVLIPRHTHLNNDDFSNIVVGNRLLVEVIGKRFELNESFISVVGKLIQIID
tara:strand:- start:627 stop:1133 length:507 start_codon:yes stop_codon:yes gene_type:complete